MNSRESPEYRHWRMEVKRRDGKYCQWPGCTKIGKQIHHIIPFSRNLALRTDVSNGISLCVKCHGKVKNKENDYALMFLAIVEKNTKEYDKRKRKNK